DIEDIHRVRHRCIGIRNRRIADDDFALVTNRAAHVYSSQTTLSEVVVGDCVDTPFAELRHIAALLKSASKVVGTHVKVPLVESRLVAGATPPDAQIATWTVRVAK